MVVREMIVIDGQTYTYTRSDAGLKVRKVGTDEIYTDAMDVLDFEYEETDIPIESFEINGQSGY